MQGKVLNVAGVYGANSYSARRIFWYDLNNFKDLGVFLETLMLSSLSPKLEKVLCLTIYLVLNFMIGLIRMSSWLFLLWVLPLLGLMGGWVIKGLRGSLIEFFAISLFRYLVQFQV